MSKVLSLKEDNFESNGETVTCWKVELDDKTNPVPCYSAEAANLKVGEDLPEGWEVKKSKKDKDYLAVPKKSGGRGGFEAAFRNTQAGQFYEQERMDRRTALMQAVGALEGADFTEPWEYVGEPQNSPTMERWEVYANHFYAWLRATSTTGVPAISSPVVETGGVLKEAGPRSQSQGSSPTSSPEATGPAVLTGESSAANGSGGLAAAVGEVEGGGYPDGEDGPTLLDHLYAKYGNGSKALMAARKLYADVNPPSSLADLSEERMTELLERV